MINVKIRLNETDRELIRHIAKSARIAGCAGYVYRVYDADRVVAYVLKKVAAAIENDQKPHHI